MNDSFRQSNTTATVKKYPSNTPPNDTWTIEQVLHWSLDQYHSAAIRRTNSHLDALKRQCENECDDVLMLHELAVRMKERGELKEDEDDDDDNYDEVVMMMMAGGENADPQQVAEEENHVNNNLKPSSSSALSKLTSSQPKSSTTTNNNHTSATATTTKKTLQITILTGPHAPQTIQLQPKHTQPCLIGRSKGKKFLRNGISLSKDQEVSTTHGKFSMEEVVSTTTLLDDDENDHDSSGSNDTGGGGGGVVQNKFYYTDVGSTNGSTVGEARLEPNVRVEIEEGMVLRIGNSTLKIEFG